MSKILQIDTDLQIPNRILKDDTNKVKQITDKAQNIAFTQSDASKQPIYNYDGYYEFDGVDDELSGGKSVSLPQNDNYTFAIKFNQNIAGAQVIFNKWVEGGGVGASEFMLYLANNIARWYQAGVAGNSGVRRTVEYSFNSNEDVTIYVIKQKIATNSYKLALIIKDETNPNFIVGQVTTILDTPPLTDTPIRLGKGNFGTSFNGIIYGATFENQNIIDISSLGTLDTVVLPDFNPFNFYHRYKDDGTKKLYLSSKYLKGAVINENNEINSIENIFGGNIVHAQLNAPILTKRGIRQLQGECVFDQDISIVQNDVFLGGWVTSETLLSANFQLIRFSVASSPYFVVFTRNGGVGYYITDGNTIQSIEVGNSIKLLEYNYVSYLRMGLDNLLFINGILLSRITESSILNIPITTNNIVAQNRDSGGNAHLYDDIFLSLNREVDPTGYAIGDKVFEPPRRGGFNTGWYEGQEWVRESIANGSGKLYLSSRYTENAVIDSGTGEITSIKDGIIGVAYSCNGGAVLKNAFATISTSNTSISTDVNSTPARGASDFFSSLWVYYPIEVTGSNYTFQIFDTAFSLGRLSNGNLYVYSANDGAYLTDSIPSKDGMWQHIAVLRFESQYFIFVQGILKAVASSNNYDYSLTPRSFGIFSTNNYIGISADDALFIDEAIIDITGYSVGDKVFTPPRRMSSQLQQIKNNPETYLD